MRFAARTGWNLESNRFSCALEQERSRGKQLLDLTVSNPTACGLRYDESQILAAINQPAALIYEPAAQGLQIAREAVSAYYATEHIGSIVPPQNIFLTTGTSEAYSYAFRLLCDPGDEVLVPRPSYPLFDFLASIHDVHLVPYHLLYDHGWQIDFHSLRSAITPKTRAVMVVHPNNPTGSYLKAREADELNRICSKSDLAIIVDEVFLDYPFTDVAAKSFSDNSSSLTFTLSGLSKISGLPQMKVAWMVVSGPDQIRRNAIEKLDVIADTYLSMNAPLQWATPALLDTRHGFQQQLKERLKRNLRELDDRLLSQNACQRLELDAGWYATLRVPVTRTDEDLAILLMQQQSVIVHPGHFFDFESDGQLILSLMTPEKEFREGLARVLYSIAKQ
jgi:alanine-synthesizing transaminase